MSFNTIPIKLVRKILRHATEFRGLFDTHSHRIIADEEVQTAVEVVRAVWTTKAALRLVSRLFHDVVEEFVFEAVIATDLEYFRQLLERLRERATSTEFPPEHRVKWLAIRFNIAYMSEADWDDWNNLWHALAVFSNVTTLYLCPMYLRGSGPLWKGSRYSWVPVPEQGYLELSPHMVEKLFTAYGCLVRNLHLPSAVHLPYFAFQSCLRLLERVESLTIDGEFSHLPTEEGNTVSARRATAKVSLSRLHTLRIRKMDSILQHMATWHLPRLTHLWLRPTFLAAAVEASAPGRLSSSHFLLHHGPQIRTLEVDWSKNDEDDDEDDELSISFHAVPNMECLVLRSPPGLITSPNHAFGISQTNLNLAEIIIYNWPLYDGISWEGGEADLDVEGLLHAVEAGRFPFLRKIHIKYDGKDPTPLLAGRRERFRSYGVAWELEHWENEDHPHRRHEYAY